MPTVLSKFKKPKNEENPIIPAKKLTRSTILDCIQQQEEQALIASTYLKQGDHASAKPVWSRIAQSLLLLKQNQDQVDLHLSKVTIEDLSFNLYYAFINIAVCCIQLNQPHDDITAVLQFAKEEIPEQLDAYQVLIEYWLDLNTEEHSKKATTLLESLVHQRTYPEQQEFAGSMLIVLTVDQKYQPPNNEAIQDFLSVANQQLPIVILAKAAFELTGKNDKAILLIYRQLLQRTDLSKAERAMAHQHRALLKLESKYGYCHTEIVADLKTYYQFTHNNEDLFQLALTLQQNPDVSKSESQKAIEHLNFLIQRDYGAAALFLGECYLLGHNHIEQDQTLGIRLIKNGIQQCEDSPEHITGLNKKHYANAYDLLGQYAIEEEQASPEIVMSYFERSYQMGNAHAAIKLARHAMTDHQQGRAMLICESILKAGTSMKEVVFNFQNTQRQHPIHTRTIQEAHYLLGMCYEHETIKGQNLERSTQHYTAAIKLKSIPSVGQRLNQIGFFHHSTQVKHLMDLKHLILMSFETKVICEHSELIQYIESIENHLKRLNPKTRPEIAAAAPPEPESEPGGIETLTPTKIPPPKKASSAKKATPTTEKPSELRPPQPRTVLELLEAIAQNSDRSSTKKVALILDQLKRHKESLDGHSKAKAVQLIADLIDQSHYTRRTCILNTLHQLTPLFNPEEISRLNQWRLLDIFNGLKKMKVSPDHPALTLWLKPLCAKIIMLLESRALSPKATLFLINALTGLLPCRHPQLKRALSELIQLIAEDPISTLFPNSILVHSLALCHYGDPTLFDPRAFDPLIQQVVRESQTQTDERSQKQALLGLGYFSPFYQKTALFDTVNGAVEQLIQARASSAHTEVTASRLQVDVTQHLQYLIRRHKVTLVEEHVIAGLPVDCWIKRYRGVENLVFQINGPCHYLLTQDQTGKEHYIPHVTSQFNHDHLTRAGCTVVELSFEKVPHTPELMKEKWNAEWLQEKIQSAHRERQIDTASAKAPSSTAKSGLFSAARCDEPPPIPTQYKKEHP